MSASVAFICRGRDGGRIVMIRCDAAACSAEVHYSTQEEYIDAGRAGWRRVGDGENTKHFCPGHAP